MKPLIALVAAKKWTAAAILSGSLIGATAVAGAAGGVGPMQALHNVSAAPASSTAATTATVTATASSSPTSVPANTASNSTTTRVSSPVIRDSHYSENEGGEGGSNIVRVTNEQDNQLRVDGNIQLNHIEGKVARPVNSAYAYSSCTDCQSFAVALQINLIDKAATDIQPQNYAVALNYKCTRCVTVARALQYNYTVSDPNQVPEDVSGLIRDMNSQLRDLRHEHNFSASEAESRINAVIAQFQSLASSLNNKRSEDTQSTNPNATPQPTLTVTPTSTPSSSAAVTPTDTPGTTTPVTTGTVTPTPTLTQTPTAMPTPTETATNASG